MNMNHSVCASVQPATLKAWLHDGGEIALLDVREHGRYGEAHLFYATNVPYSRLEFEALRLAPRKSARIVVYGEDSSDAGKAAQALAALGYRDVHVLEGGVQAWKQQDYVLFAGVNLPSKTFGELAEHEYHTPAMGVDELNRRIRAGENLAVLDGRPFTEYQKMSIPTATCCPNGELALHVADLVPDESTTIVVNCAGRTRSIIGAQTLINLGVKNPVYALENGTQGWFLNDYSLEHGQTRRHALSASPAGLAKARERAAGLARRLGVRTIDVQTYRGMCAEPDRSTYLFDVRSPEEYRAGTYPQAVHAPGGQLIQATDQYAAVRGARLVLLDAEGVRAPTVAGWLSQLGWDAYVLDTAGVELDAPPAAAPSLASALPRIGAQQVRELRDQGALLIDLHPSMDYRREHVQGARWSIRELAPGMELDGHRHVVLLADDERVAELYARDLRAAPGTALYVCAGEQPWREAGLPLETTPDVPPDHECIDFLFFVHDRHSGNKAAAMKYLEWETNLVNQIDSQERATYRFSL